jgi:hypothetical protein
MSQTSGDQEVDDRHTLMSKTGEICPEQNVEPVRD